MCLMFKIYNLISYFIHFHYSHRNMINCTNVQYFIILLSNIIINQIGLTFLSSVMVVVMYFLSYFKIILYIIHYLRTLYIYHVIIKIAKSKV